MFDNSLSLVWRMNNGFSLSLSLSFPTSNAGTIVSAAVEGEESDSMEGGGGGEVVVVVRREYE